MKRFLRQVLIYGFPLLCLLALAAAVITFRTPDRETTDITDEITLLGDIALQHPLEDILQAFQRRYAIRVNRRYATEEDFWEAFDQTDAVDVLLTARHARVAIGHGRERIRSTHTIAHRTEHPLTNAEETEIVTLHLLDGSAPREMLNEFVRFLTGAAAKEILARHGYMPVEP